MTLLEVRGFNISGRVIAAEKLDREIYLMTRRFGSDGNVGAYSANGRTDRTGRFTIRNVIPGKYLITAQSDDSSPSAIQSGVLWGTHEVEVTDADVADVTVLVGHAGAIDGEIEWPLNTSEIDRRKIRVEVSPEANVEGFYFAQGGGEVAPDLKFNSRNVSEGRVRLNVLLPSGPHYVKDVRIEGREVIDQIFEIRNNDRLRAVVSIAADGAEIDGTAKTEGAEAPAKAVTVLAMVEGVGPRAKARFRGRTQTDQAGRFSLRGLPPGNYLWAAFANLDWEGRWTRTFQDSSRG